MARASARHHGAGELPTKKGGRCLRYQMTQSFPRLSLPQAQFGALRGDYGFRSAHRDGAVYAVYCFSVDGWPLIRARCMLFM